MSLIFARGTIGKKNCFKINSQCQCGNIVTAYKKILRNYM